MAKKVKKRISAFMKIFYFLRRFLEFDTKGYRLLPDNVPERGERAKTFQSVPAYTMCVAQKAQYFKTLGMLWHALERCQKKGPKKKNYGKPHFDASQFLSRTVCFSDLS